MSTTISDTVPQRDLYRRGIWSACIWAWPVCVVTFGVFFAVVAGFIHHPASHGVHHVSRSYMRRIAPRFAPG